MVLPLTLDPSKEFFFSNSFRKNILLCLRILKHQILPTESITVSPYLLPKMKIMFSETFKSHHIVRIPHLSTDSSDDSTWVQLLKKCVTPQAKDLTHETTSGWEQPTGFSQSLNTSTNAFSLQHSGSNCDLVSPSADTYFLGFFAGFSTTTWLSASSHFLFTVSASPLMLFFSPRLRRNLIILAWFWYVDLGMKSQLNGYNSSTKGPSSF